MKKIMYFLLFLGFAAFSTCSVFGDRAKAQTFQYQPSAVTLIGQTTPSLRTFEFRPKRYNFMINWDFDPFRKVPPAEEFSIAKIFSPKLPGPYIRTSCSNPHYDFEIEFKLANTGYGY